MKFIEYNIQSSDKQWDNFKDNFMVKITLNGNMHKESFWVWIESISGDSVTGIICNNLISNELEIGQKITFDKKNIKEISSRSYTKEETNSSILLIKIGNNPITKYFESLNIKFSQSQ
jgi:hypothetical protein